MIERLLEGEFAHKHESDDRTLYSDVTYAGLERLQQNDMLSNASEPLLPDGSTFVNLLSDYPFFRADIEVLTDKFGMPAVYITGVHYDNSGRKTRAILDQKARIEIRKRVTEYFFEAKDLSIEKQSVSINYTLPSQPESLML